MSLGPYAEREQGLFHPSQRTVSPLPYHLGGSHMYGADISPALGVTLPRGPECSRPYHGVEFHPSEAFPKNFVLFDQTDERSRVMFYPGFTHNFNGPLNDVHRMVEPDNAYENNNDLEDRASSSFFKEDTKDIDALLSLEEEDDDDDEVSTARNLGSFNCSSPESCSSYGLKPRKLKVSSSTCNSNRGGSSEECKRQKMRKMVKALRAIVPGADHMNTAGVLDEAVRYLKSLKVEVKKLGIGNFDDFDQDAIHGALFRFVISVCGLSLLHFKLGPYWLLKG
ncbi:hypothetical protein Syun_009191 [Stephania yunnanensis]|uniref:BHLH domain-containing protein n=1 Tax=Stephania yunnanensis TaxID=152371 RepID=A0AAP0KE69_9MAGN